MTSTWMTLAALGVSLVLGILLLRQRRQVARLRRALDEKPSRSTADQELSNLVRDMQTVIYTARATGDFATVFISENVAKLTGYPAESFTDAAEFLKSRIHPDDLAGVREQSERLFREGETQGEYRFRFSDGSYRWMQDTRLLVPDEHGAPGMIVGSWIDVTDRKLADQVQRQSEVQLHAVMARQQGVREEERARIAREVHDVVGQLLTALTMDMAWLRRHLSGVEDEALQKTMSDKLDEVQELTDSMTRTVQEIASDLRPGVLDDLGLGSAIRYEVGRFAKRAGIACDITVPDIDPPSDPQAAIQIFRVLQEILTNVARHAGASRVSVCLDQSPDELLLEVRDDGVGVAANTLSSPKSLGLRGIRERAAQLGGSFTIESGATPGTTARLKVPFGNAPADA